MAEREEVVDSASERSSILEGLRCVFICLGKGGML